MLRKLTILLLDTDNGISSDAYTELLNHLSEQDTITLNNNVDCNDNMFYLPINHNLHDWKINND